MPLDLDTTLARGHFDAHATDRAALRGTRGGGDDSAALADAAVQFETLLLKQLVAAMRETVLTDKESEGDQLTEHLIEDALATHLARSGGVGLAELIVRDAEGPPSAPGPDALGLEAGASDSRVPTSSTHAPSSTDPTHITPGVSVGGPNPEATDANDPARSRQLSVIPAAQRPAESRAPTPPTSPVAGPDAAAAGAWGGHRLAIPPAPSEGSSSPPRPRPLEYTAKPPDAADLLRRLLAPAAEPAVEAAPATSTKIVEDD